MLLNTAAMQVADEEGEEESKARRVSAPWAYARSLAWLRPVLVLAALYLVALSFIVLLFSQLPTPSQLAGTLPSWSGPPISIPSACRGRMAPC